MKNFLLLPIRLALILAGLVMTFVLVLIWLPLAILEQLILPGSERK